MELCIQLAIIMVGQQALNSVLEMVLPFLYKWYNTFMLATGLDSHDSDEDVVDGGVSKQWTEDYKLLDWGDRGLFNEYLEMVIQYGFVTIFVSAFPLAPVFALINNVLEMRLDARKFLVFYRRPVPLRAPNIGVWFRILDVLAKIAVFSNALIIAFSSNFIPRLVYMISVSPDHSDQGFLNHSLAYFNTSDFQYNIRPIDPSFNVSICSVSPDHSDQGFLNHSLAYFNTSDFQYNIRPIDPSFNVSICRSAFSCNRISCLVYMISVSPDHSDQGFLNHSLAYFNTSDFQYNIRPIDPSFNVSICRSAFSCNRISCLVYKTSVSPDHSDQGFLNHSLAYFNTSDFQYNIRPIDPSFNVSICR
ncbi:Anoctamin-1 [Homalodisca vitripennis]|nr:Anoctamin-1 [Homalodisca vitripennis]